MARSFEILVPVLAVVVTLHPLNLFIESQLGMIIPEAIMSLVKPLVAASDTPPAVLLSVCCAGSLVRRDPRCTNRHRHNEPLLDGKPVS